MQLSLQVFEYENQKQCRTIDIGGEVFFHVNDICTILGYANPRKALSDHVDPEDVTKRDTPTAGGNQSQNYVNESGMYSLIFGSRMEGAKKFKRWVTSEVLPSIRKKGQFVLPETSEIPKFIRRYNDNWDRVKVGYFSILSELTIRVYGRLEHVGHRMAENAPDGRELRPDVSVGRLYSDWLKLYDPDNAENYIFYQHKLPNGIEVEARQYPLDMFPSFIRYVDEVWIPERSYLYFKDRDISALPHLNKMLPGVDVNQKLQNKNQTNLSISKSLPPVE